MIASFFLLCFTSGPDWAGGAALAWLLNSNASYASKLGLCMLFCEIRR